MSVFDITIALFRTRRGRSRAAVETRRHLLRKQGDAAAASAGPVGGEGQA